MDANVSAERGEVIALSIAQHLSSRESPKFTVNTEQLRALPQVSEQMEMGRHLSSLSHQSYIHSSSMV